MRRGDDRGMSTNQTHRLRGSSGFTLIQASLVAAVALTLLAVIIPAFVQMTRRARTVEAVERLAILYRGSVAYYTGTRPTQSLAPVIPPRQFPISVGVTPAVVPAARHVTDAPGTWRQPTWEALSFAIDDPHYFSYQYDSEGSGATASFTARALGDLDGNGVRSTFERSGRSNAQLEVEPVGGLWIRDPVE
jgi:type II secretory pathway pseudopilin PulG